MRYSLILFEQLVTPVRDPANAMLLVPRFRGMFESLDALLEYVRNDYGRGIFVMTDEATGELEEWNGRRDGRYELVSLKETMPADVDPIGVGRFEGVHRVVMISPRGRRHLTPCWVEEVRR